MAVTNRLSVTPRTPTIGALVGGMDLADDHADAVIDDLRGVAPAGRLALSGEQAERWLAALNDVRLVIGSRLEIDEDVWDPRKRMPPDDPRLPMLELYDLLTVLQERLVRAVAGW